MKPRNHYPLLSIPRQHDPAPGANPDIEAEKETPDYLVPVLAVYDNPDAAAQRERATILYCQGHRTADIAARLDVPVSTVRSWLTDARYLLATELRVGREELQLRAIESARALAAEAWTAYERDRDLQRAVLAGEYDHLRRRITRPDRSSDDDSGGELLYEEFERPRYTSQAARLLTVALAAQREVARLQGLYEYVPPPPQPVDFHLYGPDPAPAPTPSDAADAAAPASPSEDEVTPSALSHADESPDRTDPFIPPQPNTNPENMEQPNTDEKEDAQIVTSLAARPGIHPHTHAEPGQVSTADTASSQLPAYGPSPRTERG